MILGSETEYRLVVQHDPAFDAVAASLLLVNSYQTDQLPPLLWDYDQEDPLRDARGFDLDDEYDVPSPQENRAINKVLPNGARYYVDHAHPEFATPECAQVLDVLRYEKAGERIMHRSLLAANQCLPPGQSLIVYKNNSDGKGNSYGYHENYLLDRRLPFQTIVDQMTPFLVSRQIFCGAGKVGAENGTEPVAYQISQRADFFETEVGLETMVKRPLINTRDEPHANRERYRRLHVIVGDANMSEYTTYLKMGTTMVVLHMLEAGYRVQDVALHNPVWACQTISHDPTCTALVPLDNGKHVTAIEVQRCFHAAAQHYIETHPECPLAYPAIVAEWGAVLDALARDPLQLADRIDWVMKLQLLTTYMAGRHSGWEDPRIALMDLQYHDVRPDKGLYFLLERRGTARRMLTEAEIVQAMDDPPEDTRAYVRGQCVKKFPTQLWGVNWDALSFKLGDGPIQRLRLDEPTHGTKHQVQPILERSATAADFVATMARAPL